MNLNDERDLLKGYLAALETTDWPLQTKIIHADKLVGRLVQVESAANDPKNDLVIPRDQLKDEMADRDTELGACLRYWLADNELTLGTLDNFTLYLGDRLDKLSRE